MQACVLGRLIGCWAGSLLLLFVIALTFGLDSFLVAVIVSLFSLPFLAVAVLVAVPFAQSVADYPELWSLAAVVISSLVSVAVGAGLIATVVAAPSAIAFVIWMRLRPINGRAA